MRAADDGRVPTLDGIRGLAILLVMQFHFYGLAFGFAGRPAVQPLDRFIFEIAGVGWAGVDLFFVLSGFLITGILYDAKSSEHYFRNFYARRSLRIFPLYYGYLIFMLVVLPHLHPLDVPGEVPNLRSHQLWYWTFLVNVAASVKPLHDGDLAIVHSHFWSLAVEEQFYLTWPLVVLLLDRRRLMELCAGLMAGALVVRIALHVDASSSFVYPNAAHVLTPARMDALAAGAFVALAARSPGGALARLARWAPAVGGVSLTVLIGLFLSEGGLSPGNTRVDTIGFTALAALFAALLVVAVTAPAGSRFHAILSHRVLGSLGRYSYAAYVFHLLIAFELAILVNAHGLLRGVTGLQLPWNVAFSLLATGVTLSAAWLSWHLYEKQFLRLNACVPYGPPGRAAAGRSAAERSSTEPAGVAR